MKINIIGWYNKKNCGDESFKYVFSEIFNEHEIFFTTQQIDESCDFFILGGGDVVKDFYLKSIPNEKKIHCIGVGLGYESESELLREKNIQSVWVRNKEDVEVLKKINISSNYTPDIVFYLEKPKKIINHISSNRKKMGVILTDHINPSVANKDIKEISYTEYFKWELAESLDYLSQFYEVYFIALSEYYYANDNKMNIDIQSRMQNGYKSNLIIESGEPERLMDIIQQMDLVVSMKFHGLIFSTICNIPFINIGTSRKTNKFCQEMCISDISFNPKTFNKEDFLSKVKYVEHNKKDIQNKLSEIDERNKELLKNNIEEWKKMIK